MAYFNSIHNSQKHGNYSDNWKHGFTRLDKKMYYKNWLQNWSLYTIFKFCSTKENVRQIEFKSLTMTLQKSNLKSVHKNCSYFCEKSNKMYNIFYWF